MLQRWLSDLLNLFFPDQDDPQRLWAWPWILGMASLLALLVLARAFVF